MNQPKLKQIKSKKLRRCWSSEFAE